jgi:L-ascorbate metabolism protein UlaG (beta-lactamase superfamily)
MKKLFNTVFFLTSCLLVNAQTSISKKIIDSDSFETSKGRLVITFFGHASLMLEAGNVAIYVDPVSIEANYAKLPKANLVLITHEHDDHLDLKALALLTEPATKTVISQSCKGKIEKAIVMLNGDEQTFGDFHIKAVPAYNIVNSNKGVLYHPKGNGNGYVITFGNKKIYIGGDTENIPEMANLQNIDIAFLPMNLPFTMTPQMVADGAKSFMPKILYPYHTGETDTQLLVDLLKGSPIEIRIRKMK